MLNTKVDETTQGGINGSGIDRLCRVLGYTPTFLEKLKCQGGDIDAQSSVYEYLIMHIRTLVSRKRNLLSNTT